MKKGLKIALFLLLMIPSAYSLTLNATPGLTACLPSDYNSTDLVQGLTFTSDAQLSNTVYKVGAGSYYYAGSNNNLYNTSPVYAAGTRDFGVNTWVYINNTGTTYRIMYDNAIDGNNHDWQLVLQSTGKLGLVFNNATSGITRGQLTNDIVPTETWFMVTATYDWYTNNISIYWDGVFKQSISSTAWGFTGGYWWIGSNGGETNDYVGYIDEITYWVGWYPNASVITELYNSGSGTTCADIIASGQGGEEEPPADSCLTSYVDCSDYCQWDEAREISGDLTFYNTGKVILSAPWTFTGQNQWINIDAGCDFDIVSGGSIN